MRLSTKYISAICFIFQFLLNILYKKPSGKQSKESVAVGEEGPGKQVKH